MGQAGSNDEKHWGSKISLDCPFKRRSENTRKIMPLFSEARCVKQAKFTICANIAIKTFLKLSALNNAYLNGIMPMSSID